MTVAAIALFIALVLAEYAFLIWLQWRCVVCDEVCFPYLTCRRHRHL